MYLKHNKDEVLKIGLGLFHEKGYNNLGVDELCKRTKMTKGAFYNAFKSKEGFLNQAISLYGTQNLNRIKKELEPKESETAIERLKGFYLKMLEIQPNINFKGCFVNNIISELGTSNESISAKCLNEYNAFLDQIIPTIKEAKESGQIKNELSTKQIAELLHSTFYGVLTLSKSNRDYKQGINIINTLFKIL